MSATPVKAPVISLSEGFGALVVKGPNIEVEVRDGGTIIVRAGDVETASATASLSNTASPAASTIGDVMPEGHEHAGWIYGGVSKTTSKPFYIAPKDSGVMEWREAMDYAARSNARLPSCEELQQIYQARNDGALKGTFNTTGSGPAGWYWSAVQGTTSYAWSQRFSDGFQYDTNKLNASSLRCVRR